MSEDQKIYPKILKVRPLDRVQMHGFAIQLECSDGTVKDYYLKAFEGLSVLDMIIFRKKAFRYSSLQTVSIGNDNSIIFDNGIAINEEELFKDSFDVYVMKKECVKFYEDDDVVLEKRYQLIRIKKENVTDEIKKDENKCSFYNSPVENIYDEYGNVLSEACLEFENSVRFYEDYMKVQTQPHGKWGLMNYSGEWILPPVYEKLIKYDDKCYKGKRIILGKEKNVLILNGKEIDEVYFGNDVKIIWEGSPIVKGRFKFFSKSKGLYGIIDYKGNIIIEPQFTHMKDFYYGYSTFTILVDGKVRRGLMDQECNIIVPPEYSHLYAKPGCIVFRRESREDVGVMDYNCNVIVPPMFKFVKLYDEKHKIVIGGKYGQIGAYSVEQNKWILSPQYYDVYPFDDFLHTEGEDDLRYFYDGRIYKGVYVDEQGNDYSQYACRYDDLVAYSIPDKDKNPCKSTQVIATLDMKPVYKTDYILVFPKHAFIRACRLNRKKCQLLTRQGNKISENYYWHIKSRKHQLKCYFDDGMDYFKVSYKNKMWEEIRDDAEFFY